MNVNKSKEIEFDIPFSFNIKDDTVRYDLVGEDKFDLEESVMKLISNVDKKEVVNYFDIMKKKNERYNLLKKVLYSNEGIPEAQYYLAQTYQQGINVEVDLKKAFSLFLKSANQGNLDAQYYVGICYRNGIGVEKNLKKSILYFENSAIGGIENSKIQLANVYFLVKDYQKSFDIFKDLSKNGDSDAIHKLGIFYQEGIIVDKNIKKAIELFEQSSMKGNSDAQNSLGNLYFHGIHVEQNFGIAFDYYRKSGIQGNPIGQKNLGICYQNGYGVDQDDKLALEFFEKSSDQNNSDAQLHLGLCYYLGKGVDINIKKSMELFEKSSSQGNSKAEYVLNLIGDSQVEQIEETDSDNEEQSKLQLDLEELREKEKDYLSIQESLNSILAGKELEIEQLRQEFTVTNNKYQNELNEAKEEMNKLNLQIESLQEYQKSQQIEQTKHQVDMIMLQGKLQSLQESYEQKLIELSNEKETEIEKLKGDMKMNDEKDLEERFELLLKQRDEDILKLKNEISILKEQLSTISTLNKEKDIELMKLQQQLKLLTENNDRFLLDFESSSVELKRLRLYVKEMEQEENAKTDLLNQKESNIQDLSENLSFLKEQNQRDIQSLEEELKNIERLLSKKDEEFQIKQNEFESSIEKKNKEIDGFRHEFDLLKEEKFKLNEEIRKLKLENEMQMKLNAELKSKQLSKVKEIKHIDSPMVSPKKHVESPILSPRSRHKSIPKIIESNEMTETFNTELVPIVKKPRRKSQIDPSTSTENSEEIKHEFNYGPDDSESNGWKTVTSSLMSKKQVDRFFTQVIRKEKCSSCEKIVYANEKICAGKNQYHEKCFKCSVCNKKLTILNYVISNGENQTLYCKNHAKVVSLSKIKK